MKINNLKIFSTLAFYFFLVYTSNAQPGGGGGEADVPIDGGLSILAGAGVAYGSKKIMDYRKKSKTEKVN